MNKLALIGGKEISKYTIADKLWRVISEVSSVDFKFDVVPLETREEVDDYYKLFTVDEKFLGFNVALPWKDELSKMVDEVLLVVPEVLSINTVYKNSGRSTAATNTDVIGVIGALKYFIGKVPRGNILIFGAGGAGLPTAYYLSRHFGVKVYIYDIKPVVLNEDSQIIILETLEDITNDTYDLIINATPLGKYYLNSKIISFSSPLDIDLLSKISKPGTVLQEMNYLPEHSLFLQIGESLNLKVVPGYLMLIFQALGSFEKYFNRRLADEQIDKIVKQMIKYVSMREFEVLRVAQ